ncbi:MAG TPA: hypothetical protein VGT44_15880 [Ktedonobacteraceae bacterium]|nr:hypothetical protein [Ktedonobacteraceae bacterium]
MVVSSWSLLDYPAALYAAHAFQMLAGESHREKPYVGPHPWQRFVEESIALAFRQHPASRCLPEMIGSTGAVDKATMAAGTTCFHQAVDPTPSQQETSLTALPGEACLTAG